MTMQSTLDSMQLETGDLVLFNRRCSGMSVFGALVCASAKLTTQSKWDHIGVVLRRDGALFLLEASLTGMKTRPLAERLTRSDSHEIAVRRLSGAARSPEVCARIDAFAREIADRPYETNLLTLFNAAVENRAKAQGERIGVELEHTIRDVEMLRAELDASAGLATDLQRAALQHELNRIERERIPALKRALVEHRSLFENTHDMSKLFCSELTAALYQRAGWLAQSPAPSNYTPKSFATNKLPLLHSASLGPLIYIRQQRDERDQHGANTAAPRASMPSPHHQRPVELFESIMRHNLLAHVSPASDPSIRPLATAADRAALWPRFEPVAFAPGQTIVESGAACDSMFIIDRGQCEVVAPAAASPSARKEGGSPLSHVCLGVLRRGNTFNSECMLFDRASAVTVRAASTTASSTSPPTTATHPSETGDRDSAAPSVVHAWRLRKSDWAEFVCERRAALPTSAASASNVGASLKPLSDLPSPPPLAFEIASDAHLDAASVAAVRHVLDSHPLFKRVRQKAARGDRAFADAAVASFYKIRFAAGDTIIEQNELGELFYIVADGECEASIAKPAHSLAPSSAPSSSASPSSSSSSTALVSTFHAGQTFGEASLLYNSPRGASVRAKTDVTLLVIDRPAFQRLSGAGSRFLQHAFLRHASVHRRGQAFMSKQDFLRAMRSSAAAAGSGSPTAAASSAAASTRQPSLEPHDLSRLDRLMLRLVARNTDSDAISFSEFVHFDMLMSSADRELLVLFHLLDRDKNGLIDRDEFCHFVAEQQSSPPQPVSQQQPPLPPLLSQQMAMDALARHPLIVELFGANGERRLSEWQFRRLLGGGADGSQAPPTPASSSSFSFLSHLFTNRTDAGATRRRAMAALLPEIFSDIDSLSRALERTSFGADLVLTPSHAPLSSSAADDQRQHQHDPLYLLGSGFAGALARTAVAPIERVRILMQTQPLAAALASVGRHAGAAPFASLASSSASSASTAPSSAGICGVWRGLGAVYKSDGVGGLFRGNGLNVARIVPCIAFEFAAFEFFKRAWIRSDTFARFHPEQSNSSFSASSAGSHRHHAADRLSLVELALMGGAAGVVSNALFYPLDLLRALVTVQRGSSGTNSQTGFAAATGTGAASVRRARDFVASIWRAEGARGFFRGFGTSMVYIFPYAGATVAASESLRPLLPRDNDCDAATTSPLWLIAGSALAGLVGQTMVYPLDTIRRLQQVSSLVASTADGPASWSFRRVCERVYGERGARGFFAGLSASFLKAAPSAAVSVVALSEISKRISPPDESR